MISLPPPDDSGENDSGRSSRPGNQSRDRGRSDCPLPSIDDLLRYIMQIPGLLMLGVLPEGKANVILRALQTVLGAQLRRSQGAKQQQTPDELVELCKQNPLLLNTITPMLTEEQFQYLMERIHGPDQ